MLGESDIRAARLAVSRYGADPDRVQQLLQAVLAADGHGEPLDLLDVLLREQLLTKKQVNDLRFGLEDTQVDPDSDLDHRARMKRETEANANPHGPSLATLPADLRQIAGYRILRKLGEGGMGAVFLAFDPKHGRQVAIKVLSPEHAGVQTALDRFLREGTSGRALNHVNIVRNYETGHDAERGLHYLVLEYVDGPSGHDLLERFGKLKIADAVHVILAIANGLEHAHRGAVIHRDIKPGNILLTSAGVAKLSDFGLARRTNEDSHITHAKQGVGTPYYMPYEQAINGKRADERSDIYALGATLYHLLTGEVPFPGINALDILEKKDTGVYLPAQAFNPDVPGSLERILSRMLARRPEHRYASASDLIVALERTELAALVPSFVDIDLAMRDPTVRDRIAAAESPTQQDVRVIPAAKPQAVSEDFWYVRVRDKQGRVFKAKLTRDQVVQRLKDGRITLSAEAARAAQGDYRPLHFYDEFADVAPIRAPRKPAPRKPERAAWYRLSWPWLVSAALGVVILVLLGLTFCVR